MGEYEPDDSRDVTRSAGSGGIEPERTGPREEQARAQAEHAKRQSGGADPASTNEQQAVEAETASPRPEYDQYEVNQASSTNKQSMENGRMSQSMGGQSQSMGSSQEGENGGKAQTGYGNSRDEQGRSDEGMRDDKTAQHEQAIPGEVSDRPDEKLYADAHPPMLDEDERPSR